MRGERRMPGLQCVMGDAGYQLLSDGNRLLFVRLGREGAEDASRMIDGPKSFAEGGGNASLRKKNVRRVRCTLNGRRATIELDIGGRVRRIYTDDADETVLRELFAGMKLRIADAQGDADHRQDGRDVALLGAWFAAGLLRVLGNGIGGFGEWFVLVWAALPPVWLWMLGRDFARRPKTARSRLHIGAGMLACMLSCVGLWMAFRGREIEWGQTVLPIIVIAAIAAALFGVAGRSFAWRRLLSAFVAALLLYAPGTALYLNELLPSGEHVGAGTVISADSEYARGNWTYSAVIEVEGIECQYSITREQFDGLEPGDQMIVRNRLGALGIAYTTVEKPESEKDQQDEAA